MAIKIQPGIEINLSRRARVYCALSGFKTSDLTTARAPGSHSLIQPRLLSSQDTRSSRLLDRVSESCLTIMSHSRGFLAAQAR